MSVNGEEKPAAEEEDKKKQEEAPPPPPVEEKKPEAKPEETSSQNKTNDAVENGEVKTGTGDSTTESSSANKPVGFKERYPNKFKYFLKIKNDIRILNK